MEGFCPMEFCLLNQPAEHEHFEQLCTLAAGSFASPSELAELEEHLKLCPDCTQYLADICELSALLTQHTEAIFREPSES